MAMPSAARHQRGSLLLDSSWARVNEFDERGPQGRGGRSNDASAADEDRMSVDRNDDDDYDDDGYGYWTYEEEEELVTLDLGPDSKRLVQMSQEYSITGLETHTPFLQVGNVTFKGAWDQLIGTEIILQDEKSAKEAQLGQSVGRRPSSSSSSTSKQQHVLWPLAATKTDRDKNRAPGTTRRRIVMRQATNMIAKEKALQPLPHQPRTGIHLHAPTLHANKTAYIAHKGSVWVRGLGWMRKEAAAQLENLGGKEGQDDAEAPAASVPREQDQEAGAEAEAEGEGDEEENEDVEREEEDEGEQVNDIPVAELDEDTIEQVDQEANDSLATTTTQSASGQAGRKKMNEEEKMRYQLYRAMRRLEAHRSGNEHEQEMEGEEEEIELES